MKRLGLSAVFSAAVLGVCLSGANAADLPIPTKAPEAPPPPQACASAYDFLFTTCPLTWYGITVYGTIDSGLSAQTHGAPFNPDFTAGGSEVIQKMNNAARFGPIDNGLSTSNIGIKAKEQIAPGWYFVGQYEFGFEPDSLHLTDSPLSMANNRGVPVGFQSVNGDSSRGGQVDNSVGYLGVSSPIYGTLTVGRQNALTLDMVNAYDPTGGSNAFALIGFSGNTAGVGNTEDARFNTALKYRVDIYNYRFAALWQFGSYGQDNGSNGAGQVQVGGDFKNIGPGIVSVDVAYSYVKDGVFLTFPAPGAPNVNASGMPIGTQLPQVLNAQISDNQSVMAVGKYTVGALRLYGGYEWIQFGSPSDPVNTVSGFTNIAGLQMGSSFNNMTAVNNTNYSGADRDKLVQVFWTGFKYTVITNVDLIGAYYHQLQNQFITTNNACLNSGAHSQCAGTEDVISGVVDWQFAAKWDTYLGITFSQVNGGMANGFVSRNNVAGTGGVRFRF
jgi:predicted porin